MKKILSPRTKKWLLPLVLGYCLLGLGFYGLQDFFLLHPTPLADGESWGPAPPHTVFTMVMDADTHIEVADFRPADTSLEKGLVLYFHGNRQHIGHYADRVPALTQAGFRVWMMDYPGFGHSTGKFSEPLVNNIALQLYKRARVFYAPQNIVLFGRSLGTGIAAQLAAKRDCRSLVLETPYPDIASLFRPWFSIYPLHRMLHFQFPTKAYLPQVTAPILIVHGESDGVIPLSKAEQLRPLLKAQDQFVVIPGGSHNDLPQFPLYQKAIKKFLGAR
ncbi:MAG: alpha/beta fold hydrolase [Sphingobacteriia bacterium]|nr:MAG: alpha/beta fold hydrolase [Sphingobacteriia bacterium]